MDINTLGVIGAGQMGNGIAQVAATSGINVIMNDISAEFVEKGLATITRILTRNVDKGKLTESDKDSILSRISTSTDLKDMAAANFVVEAATENEALKFKIFKDLDTICPPEAILSTNTSSIPIGRIAFQTRRPDKVIGMHFMNPVPVMRLVEIIRGLATSDETFTADHEWIEIDDEIIDITASQFEGEIDYSPGQHVDWPRLTESFLETVSPFKAALRKILF